MHGHGTLFDEWRVADREAYAAEHALTLAWMEVLRGSGKGPSDEQCQRAKRLRETADDLLDLTMRDFEAKARAAASHRARPPPKS